MVYKKVIAWGCIYCTASMYAMHMQDQYRYQCASNSASLVKPEIKRETSAHVSSCLLSQTATEHSSLAKGSPSDTKTLSNPQMGTSTYKHEQSFETKSFQDEAMIIIRLQESINTETKDLASLKEQLAKHDDCLSRSFLELKDLVINQEERITHKQKIIDAYVATYQSKVQELLDTKNVFKCMSQLYFHHCKLVDEKASVELIKICNEGLTKCLATVCEDLRIQHEQMMQQVGLSINTQPDHLIDLYEQTLDGLTTAQRCTAIIELYSLSNNQEELIRDIACVAERQQNLQHAENATQLQNMLEAQKAGLAVTLTKIEKVLTHITQDIKQQTPEQRQELEALLTQTISTLAGKDAADSIVERVKECRSLAREDKTERIHGDQIQIDEQQTIQEFRDTLATKYVSCKTLQSKVHLIFELLSLQEQLVQQKAPNGIIGACKAKIDLYARNIRKELSDLPKSRPSWLCDTVGGRLIGSKPVEHIWQNFETAVHRIEKGFNELIKNKGALTSGRIEQLHQAKAACLELETCINELCHFGLDRVSSQDMGLTRKECNELISTSKKLAAISEIFTKNMHAIPASSQENSTNSYHETRSVARETTQAEPTVAHHGRGAAIWGFMGSILGCAALKYCGIYATIGITWGAGVAVTGGISLAFGGAVLAGLAIKRQLDKPSQTEVHTQDAITGHHMYKIDNQKMDFGESVMTHMRHQHVLQEDLTQPAHSYDAAPQANEITFAPAEISQQSTAQEMAPSAYRQAEKDSRLFMDQGQAQIPVQYAIVATTQSGSVSVDAASAEQLKQNLATAEMLLTKQASRQGALSNTEQATNWQGAREALDKIYSLSSQLSKLDQFEQHLDEQMLAGTAKAAKGALIGAIKGGIDFAQGTKQLLCHPQQTLQEFESAIKQLDYFVVRLCSNDPQARDEVRAGIKQFLDAPIEKKAEVATRVLVGFKIAPELLNKGISQVINAAKEVAVLEKAREFASAIGKGITETAVDSKVAVTPEGFKIPVEKDEQVAAFMESEKPVQGKDTKPGVVIDGIKDQSIITGYTETAVNYEHIFSDKHMKRGIMGLSKFADEKIAKSEIVKIFQGIVKDADSQGLLKAGGTNIIRTVINDIEAEIKFDILPDGTIRSFDGYVGRTGRDTWFNMVTCDYKGV